MAVTKAAAVRLTLFHGRGGEGPGDTAEHWLHAGAELICHTCTFVLAASPPCLCFTAALPTPVCFRVFQEPLFSI